jgi:hypothetical protein
MFNVVSRNPSKLYQGFNEDEMINGDIKQEEHFQFDLGLRWNNMSRLWADGTSWCLLPLLSTGTKVLHKIKKCLNDEESTITCRSVKASGGKSKLYYERQTVGQSVLVSSHFWGPRQIFVAVRQLRVCWYGAPSLTRRQVRRLQLLLTLASEVILGSKFPRFKNIVAL